VAVTVAPRSTRPAVNLRVDYWWVQPVITVIVLTAFVAYSAWTTFNPHNFYAGNVATAGPATTARRGTW
jgi:hypothetical protein